MGDIAEMMIDGTMCEGCGEFMDDGESPGYPRYCSKQCANDRGVEFEEDSYEDDEEEDETIDGVQDDIDSCIMWLEITIEDCKKLKLKGIPKKLNWFIKRLNAIKEELGDK